MKKLFSSPLVLIVCLVVVAAILRLLTNYLHIWNFTPIIAMALFSGATIRDKKLAFIVPMAAIILTDAILGFYQGIFVTYFALILVTAFGFLLQNRIKVVPVLLGSLGASLIFYLVTNFALIYPTTLYPHTLGGIIDSYTLAIPFFKTSIAGDLIYTCVLFGSYAVLRRTALVPSKVA
jgi:hypothetical protein